MKKITTLAIVWLFATACHSTSSSGAATEGGTPGGGACTDPSTCVGYGNPCYASVTCTDAKCAFKLHDPGYALPDAQTPGDCSYIGCDVFGNSKSMPDDLDMPDAGPCMKIFCINGSAHNPEPVPDGTSCGAGLVCSGGSCDAGH